MQPNHLSLCVVLFHGGYFLLWFGGLQEPSVRAKGRAVEGLGCHKIRNLIAAPRRTQFYGRVC